MNEHFPKDNEQMNERVNWSKIRIMWTMLLVVEGCTQSTWSNAFSISDIWAGCRYLTPQETLLKPVSAGQALQYSVCLAASIWTSTCPHSVLSGDSLEVQHRLLCRLQQHPGLHVSDWSLELTGGKFSWYILYLDTNNGYKSYAHTISCVGKCLRKLPVCVLKGMGRGVQSFPRFCVSV